MWPVEWLGEDSLNDAIVSYLLLASSFSRKYSSDGHFRYVEGRSPVTVLADWAVSSLADVMRDFFLFLSSI
ncbi:hypothetical protein SERLADRAFT_393652, partial [Serpula lacrymans var. lacrymans S7.9]